MTQERDDIHAHPSQSLLKAALSIYRAHGIAADGEKKSKARLDALAVVKLIAAIREGGNLQVRGPRKNGLLHLVVRSPRAVKFLLAQGLNPNDLNEDGETPLHSAAACGVFESAALIEKAGGDKTLRDIKGRVPAACVPKTEEGARIAALLASPKPSFLQAFRIAAARGIRRIWPLKKAPKPL